MRTSPAPFRVCFVCSGNICRSPMAESVFRRHVEKAGLDDLIKVDSAGTGGWHVGDHADRRAVATLRRRGYDIEHRARRFDPSWFDRLNLVVALDHGHLAELRALARDRADVDKIRLLRDFDPDAVGDDRGVPDPYYGGDDGFELVLDLIEAAVPGLLDEARSASA